MAGHETDDVVKLRIALDRSEDFAQRLLVFRRHFETKFLFENVLGLGADAFLELGAEKFADRPVEFHRLRGAHAENLRADDVKAGARKEINDVCRAGRWRT